MLLYGMKIYTPVYEPYIYNNSIYWSQLPEFTTAKRRNEIFVNRLGQSAPVVRLISDYSRGTKTYFHAELNDNFC
jgi:hypothetical protein